MGFNSAFKGLKSTFKQKECSNSQKYANVQPGLARRLQTSPQRHKLSFVGGKLKIKGVQPNANIPSTSHRGKVG